jgi:hypothetical protein
MRSMTIALVALGIATATASWGQTYKCTGPSGRPVYSDQPCDEKTRAQAEEQEKGKTAVPKSSLSEEERERIKFLESIMVDKKANSEQKTAAVLEAAHIRRGLQKNMSQKDREKRDALTGELASPDKAKREATLRELRKFYEE